MKFFSVVFILLLLQEVFVLYASPSVIFEKDFQTTAGDPSLDGFEVCKAYQGFVPDAKRYPEGYGIIASMQGNVHMVRMPAQGDCTLDYDFFVDPTFVITGKEICVAFNVYYHYNPENQQGGVLHFERHADHWRVLSGAISQVNYKWTAEQKIPLAQEKEMLHIAVAGKKVSVGKYTFDIPENVPAQGRFGFDKGNVPATALCLRYVKVTGEPAAEKPLFPKRSWEFPASELRTMSQWQFTFEGKLRGNTTCLDVTLDGGPAKARNRGIGWNGHLGNELLTSPWFRIISPDGTAGPKQYIHYGPIGFKEHWSAKQPYMPPADLECPVKQHYYLPAVSPRSLIEIGFEDYDCQDRRHSAHRRKMMIVSPETGEILATGDVPDANGLAAAFDSGADKKICKVIPKTVVDYAGALRYAITNHYFYDDEKIRFNIDLRQPKGKYAEGELSSTLLLEDAFHDKLREISFTTETIPSLFHGEFKTRYQCALGKLPCGVYHLKLQIAQGGRIIKEPYVAFEVFGTAPDSPTPQKASGLPRMFTGAGDVPSEVNIFDPRGEASANWAHYYSISGLGMEPAEERREWELFKIYRREHFCFLIGKKDTSPKDHVDMISNMEYFHSRICKGRYILSMQNAYDEPLIRTLLVQFLQEKKADSLPLAKFLKENPAGTVPFDMLVEFIEKYGNEWAPYACKAKDITWKEYKRTYPHAHKPASFGAIPNYLVNLKGGMTTMLFGCDLRTRLDLTNYSGFSGFEDYPLLTGDSPLEGCYYLASTKLDCPGLLQVTDMMGYCAIPEDEITVYGCPPHGILPSDIRPKRFYDFYFTVCWFSNGKFHFFTDDFFQLRTPTPEQLEESLKALNVIRKCHRERPLRTFALVTGVDCCLKQKLKCNISDVLDFEVNAPVRKRLEIISTAEEFPAWINRSVRGCGLPNGFTIKPNDLSSLTPEDVHTIVLPPLETLTDGEKLAVRKLFEGGVNLVCSENAAGLEDLFGVEKCEARPVTRIAGELAQTKLVKAEWRPVDAKVLLADEAGTPVLTLKKGKKAYAAFYTIAPTIFFRSYRENGSIAPFSQQGDGVLSQSAADLFKTIVKTPEASLTQGRMAAFREPDGAMVVCVMEDGQPGPTSAIDPELTVAGDWRKAKITADGSFTVVKSTKTETVIKLHLEPFESRVLRFK